MPTIIEMVNHTRLDCCLGAAAGMRSGVANTIHHAAQRSAFGKLLIDQPLMRNVLADLAIESEAATIGALRLARAYDESNQRRRPPLRVRGRRGRGRRAVQADRQRGAEVLALQAGRSPRRRGARVLRRQRLRRGVGHAAPVPGVAAELDLGGLGQRAVPRRPAGDRPRAGGDRGVLRRGRRGRRRRRSARRRGRRAARRARRPRGDRVARGGWSSGWPSCCRARSSFALPTRRWPTRSAHRGSARLGAGVRDAAGRHRLRAHHRAPPRCSRRRWPRRAHPPTSAEQRNRYVALFVALSGTAIALPGKNKVKKNDIARGGRRQGDRRGRGEEQEDP